MNIVRSIIEKLGAILRDLLQGKSKPVAKLPKDEKVSAQECQELKDLLPREESSLQKAQRLRDGSATKMGVLKAKNDSPRLKKELGELKTHNKELLQLILDVRDFVNDSFGKDTVITMIYRTQAEQDELYKHSEKYKQKKFKSPHQFWHAIDLRSRIYTAAEIKKIEDFINTKYNSSNYYKWTAKAHAIKGNAMHFHIQYYKA